MPILPILPLTPLLLNNNQIITSAAEVHPGGDPCLKNTDRVGEDNPEGVSVAFFACLLLCASFTLILPSTWDGYGANRGGWLIQFSHWLWDINFSGMIYG